MDADERPSKFERRYDGKLPERTRMRREEETSRGSERESKRPFYRGAPTQKLPSQRRRRYTRTPSPPSPLVTRRDQAIDDESPSPQIRAATRVRRPLITFDWRGEICRFLNIEPESTDEELFEHLENAEQKLEEADRLASLGPEAQNLTPRYQIIHRVRCSNTRQHTESLYIQEPFVVHSGPQNAHLRGSDQIRNFDLYLERNKDVALIAYKDYQCCEPSRSRMRHSEKPEDVDPLMLIVGESVCVISSAMCSALRVLAEEALIGVPHPRFEIDQEIPSPFLWWFHGRERIKLAKQFLSDYDCMHVSIFQDYLEDRFASEWAAVDSLLSQGTINIEYIHYLYLPDTILVQKSENERLGQQQAYLAVSWLLRGESDKLPGLIECVSWSFDGNFQKNTVTLSSGRIPSSTATFKITDLTLYPISFAESGLQSALRERGKMFWKCRKRNYVCYREELNDGIRSTTDPRFMIDIATYKLMHPADRVGGEFPKDLPRRVNRDDLGPEVMSQDEPPADDNFLLCLPKTIPGFNMTKKEWTSLDVSRITPVTWNREAFDSLVVDAETKKLISALVTTKIDAQKSTDLMSGKGTGLFILLHGGPGTGKTLTAESVAEYSQKPLYRVTCGDIGTKAEEVEKYLEVVMLLGKTWDCVVLLDEADVFLEQRRIFDLQRNALVSVFLRVLEYYDGILILTSNRVGIFDEAFKSRIQLTLRYKTLEEPQRRQIWENFISRLESFQNSATTSLVPHSSRSHLYQDSDLGINVQEVRSKLPELAQAKLNGREIRNAISTARQLAMFERKLMGYEHLRVVIEESRKFEEYLTELRKGFTPDEIMKDIGER